MKKFHMYGATLYKIAASTDKNCGNESKNRMKSKYFIFSMRIFKKLRFWNLTDGKKSRNKNELFQNVTYNDQKSKCHWNFATLLNFHSHSLTYKISHNLLTSPNEHTVDTLCQNKWRFKIDQTTPLKKYVHHKLNGCNLFVT